MSDLPISQKRLAALKLAVQRKQSFDSLEEMRKIKSMTIISHLIEFGCATSGNLLKLLDQKNNSILTRLVKDRMIRIMRWQNSQVYAPTSKGKTWLLENLTDDQEIDRVQGTPIRRKISGYSSEHDLLLQNAAIHWATEEAEETNSIWRLLRPRKTQQTGKVPDALIVFTRKCNAERKIAVELERTRKQPIEVICSISRLIDLLLTDGADEVVLLTPSARIHTDYMAALWALSSVEDLGLGLAPPACELLAGPVPRYGLAVASSRDAAIVSGAVGCIDLQLIDPFDGSPCTATDDFERLLFSPILWQIAMRQQEPHWPAVIERGAQSISKLSNLPPRPAYAQALMSAFSGAGEDNPMRSRGDLVRAQDRWEKVRVARVRKGRSLARFG